MYVCMCAYVWVYYKTMGEVGKIIAQLRYYLGRYLWMGMDGYGSHRATTTLRQFLSWEVGDHCCVCTRQHLIIGGMSCLYV